MAAMPLLLYMPHPIGEDVGGKARRVEERLPQRPVRAQLRGATQQVVGCGHAARVAPGEHRLECARVLLRCELCHLSERG